MAQLCTAFPIRAVGRQQTQQGIAPISQSFRQIGCGELTCALHFQLSTHPLKCTTTAAKLRRQWATTPTSAMTIKIQSEHLPRHPVSVKARSKGASPECATFVRAQPPLKQHYHNTSTFGSQKRSKKARPSSRTNNGTYRRDALLGLKILVGKDEEGEFSAQARLQ